ncbi:MAG: hypothetical protein H0U49_00295 [Parachlamydiaceae bacterium]|nr:hypothetical protein [Parachlamydiaceae bacterium]
MINIPAVAHSNMNIPNVSFFEKYSLPKTMVVPALIISGVAFAIFSVVANSLALPFSIVLGTGCISIALLATAALKVVLIKSCRKQRNTSVNECKAKIDPKCSFKEIRYDLLPNKSELEKITMIVTSLGSQSIFTLPTARGSLKKAGYEIRNLHPLRFLACALTNVKLKKEMEKLYDRRLGLAQQFVWNEFYLDYSRKLDRQNSRNNLVCYIDKFAEDLKLDSKLLHKIVVERRWQDFFKVIFEAQNTNSC